MRVTIARIKYSFKNAMRADFLGTTIGRIVAGIYTVIFSSFMYHYMVKGNVSSSFTNYAGTDDYLAYIIVGAAFYSLSVSILMAVGRTFMVELREGVINEMFLSPASRLQILLGNGIEQYLRSIAEVSVIFLMGFFIGVRFKNTNLFSYFILFLLIFFTLFSLGVLLSFIMLFMKDTYLTQNTFFLLINFLCGVYFPTEYLPKGLRYVSDCIPFTHLLKLMRRIFIFGDSISAHIAETAAIFIMSTCILILGSFLLKNYFIVLLWPILLFFTAYYSYKPLSFSEAGWSIFESNEAVVKFLIIGYLAYNCFFSLVRNALFMRSEREEGVLEIIFLSPAKRFALMYGRALGALIQNTWMFAVFTVFILVFIGGFEKETLLFFPLVFLLICISACIWGGLLNTLFLFYRDTTVIFYLLDEPMLLFSGVKMPTAIFPFWAKVISLIFPITYVLHISRGLLMSTDTLHELRNIFVGLLVILSIIVFVTSQLLRIAEIHYRKSGNINFY